MSALAQSSSAMRRLSLADMLPDFAPPRPSVRPVAVAASQPPAPTPIQPSVPTEAEIVARVEAEVMEAVRVAETRLEAEKQAALAELAERHASELAGRDAAFGATLGERLRVEIEAVETRVTALASAVVARLLGVVMTDELRNRAVAHLASSIRDALGDSESLTVAVRGPLSLYEPLAAAMGDRAAQLHFDENSSPDIIATIGDLHFETRLSEWSKAIAGAVA